MDEKTGDPLLHELVEQVRGFDPDRLRVMMDLFTTTIRTAESTGAAREESLWALTGTLVALIRSGPGHKLDALAMVQRMISLRMGMGERIDAQTAKQ